MTIGHDVEWYQLEPGTY